MQKQRQQRHQAAATVRVGSLGSLLLAGRSGVRDGAGAVFWAALAAVRPQKERRRRRRKRRETMKHAVGLLACLRSFSGCQHSRPVLQSSRWQDAAAVASSCSRRSRALLLAAVGAVLVRARRAVERQQQQQHQRAVVVLLCHSVTGGPLMKTSSC
jgi:hypothetical protein